MVILYLAKKLFMFVALPSPSWRQATMASLLLNWSSQTVPQILNAQTSRRPLRGELPFTSRTEPSAQSAVAEKNTHMKGG